MLRYLIPFLFAAVLTAQPKTEIGEINGAKFRIDVPEKWNGELVVYCHGYSATPGGFDAAKPSPAASPFTSQGYAVAQSGYVAGGWAIQEAVQDTEALRRYFTRKYGTPKETWVTGHSMGGFLTMTLMESFPTHYSGGLALCGPLSPANWFMERRVFDMMVVFEYFFPGVLPSPAAVPRGYVMSEARNQEILKQFAAKPEAASAMRRFTSIQTNKELAATLAFFTYILKDLEERGGGNPFDNRNTIYENTGSDGAVNDGVKRYTADPTSAEYLRRFYTPTGHLARPMLAIHTIYDPLVPPWVTNVYSDLAAQAGKSALFAQQYVKHDGHCAITPAEIGRGFEQLRAWKAGGARPGRSPE